jgi:hypothetical protein
MFASPGDCFGGGVSLSPSSRGFALVSNVSRDGTFSPICVNHAQRQRAHRPYSSILRFGPIAFSRAATSQFSRQRIKLHFWHRKGGVCPLQAQTCKYCNMSFAGAKFFSLKWRLVRAGPLRKVVIWVAILMIAVLLVMNVLRG